MLIFLPLKLRIVFYVELSAKLLMTSKKSPTLLTDVKSKLKQIKKIGKYPYFQIAS